MSIRRTKPLLCICYSCLHPKRFHTTSILAAKSAQRSPRVVNKERVVSAAHGNVRASKALSNNESQDTVALLNALQTVHKRGGLALTPEKAIDFLREYQSRGLRRLGPGWESSLCAEYGIPPSTLTALSIATRLPSPRISKSLLHSASTLGDFPATLQLISSAIRQTALSSSDLVTPLKHLVTLVKASDPAAILLYARVLEARGRQDDALRYYRKASAFGEEFEGCAAALVGESRILLARKDEAAAEVLLRRAALDLDDPVAYLVLSALPSASAAERETFLMKAAASGVPRACYDLGVLELKKVWVKKVGKGKQGGEVEMEMENSMSSELGMAREWLELADAMGHKSGTAGLWRDLFARGGVPWGVLAETNGWREEVL